MTDPAPGTPLRILFSPLNAGSTFWGRYQGYNARLVQVDPDGLWSVMIEEPATTGWVSSLTGNVVLGDRPADGPAPVDPHQRRETWFQTDLPDRWNPAPAVKPARFQIMGLAPVVPAPREGWLRRLLRFTTGNG